MKTKISLTVDPRVTHRAKRYARSKNTSLSALVEELLKKVSSEEPAEPAGTQASFSDRWSGRLKVAKKEESRFRHLADKYEIR